MAIATGILWFIATILIAIALWAFVIPFLKRMFKLLWFSFMIWNIARKTKNKKDKKLLMEISKGLKDLSTKD